LSHLFLLRPCRIALAAGLLFLAGLGLTACVPATVGPAPDGTGTARAAGRLTENPPSGISPTPAAVTTSVAGLTAAKVTHVVDGDTIDVSIAGQPYTVRYIGVDTPETVRPDYPVEWMGPEASAANKALVEGKTVYLEKDVSETDRYGRLLRYVYLADGTMVNAELVRQGYAQSATYPPDVKHQSLFQEMQRQAMAAGRGLWGPTPAGTPPSVPAGTATASGIVIATVDKRAEYVDIWNTGSVAQDLTGWELVSERGNQRCTLAGTLGPGDTLRVWALAKDAGQAGYNCGFRETIWSNSEPDPAVLYDDQGREVARR
jgi:micrococcal nuclease